MCRLPGRSRRAGAARLHSAPMDLHVVGPAATPDERAAIDAVLDPEIGPARGGWDGGVRDIATEGHAAHGGHDARARRDLLLPALNATAGRAGWVSRGALNHISKRLAVPPAEAYGVASFYALTPTTPRPPIVAHVCDDIACRLAGAARITQALEATVGPRGRGARRQRDDVAAEPVPRPVRAGAGGPRHGRRGGAGRPGGRRARGRRCRGGHAGLGRGGGDGGSGAGPRRAPGRPRRAARVGPEPRAPGGRRRAAAARPGRSRRPDVARRLPCRRRLRGARARDSSSAPPAVIEEVAAAKLVGRGGAAFPTGRKWAAVAAQPATPRYVVCNADESEPGTFKDRLILEEDPFALLESMTIEGVRRRRLARLPVPPRRVPAGARAAGARDRARHARPACSATTSQGSGWAFDIELRIGAGAYIVGEETALFESIEGGAARAAEQAAVPRGARPVRPAHGGQQRRDADQRPADPADGRGGVRADRDRGLHGPEAVLPVSGHVATPGRLRGHVRRRRCGELLALAGGVPGGRAIQAILLGGAAGAFVGPDALDTPLTFEGTRAAGATLGSGVVMVFDETADLADALRRIARVLPRRVVRPVRPVPGRHRAPGGAARAARRRGAARTRVDGELARFADLAQAMRDASICGLGQTASSAIESALRLGLVHFDGGGPPDGDRPHPVRAAGAADERPGGAAGPRDRRRRAHDRRHARQRPRRLDDPRGRRARWASTRRPCATSRTSRR